MTSTLLSKPLGCLATGLLLAVPSLAQLTIISQQPTSNAGHVTPGAGIRIVANQPLAANGAAALRVFSASQGLPRSSGGQSHYAVSGNELTYTPTKPWFPGEEVSVTVSGTLSATSGQVLSAPRVFKFRAAAGGTGRGYFVAREAVRVPALVEFVGARLADLDGDGDLDLLAATPDNDDPNQTPTSALVVRLNDGTGHFAGGGTYTLGVYKSSSSFLTIGDVDGDGDLDVVTYAHGYPSTRGLFTCLNDGSGRFTQIISHGGSSNYNPIALGDMDADGDLDLIRPHQSGGISVLLNNGNGLYQSFRDAALPTNTNTVSAVDIDNDGDLDLLAPINTTGTDITLYIRTNNGQGDFNNLITLPLPANTSFAGTSDFDGDGDPDLRLRHERAISYWVNDGRGAFTPGPTQQLPTAPGFLIEVDLDGDGDLDLLTGNSANRSFGTLLNNGNGTFAIGPQSVVSQFAQRLAAGDIDNDGDLDLAGITGDGVITVYLNQPSAAALATRSPGPSAELAIEAYPNPYEQELNLRVQAAQAGPAQLSLYDAQGRRLWAQTAQLRAGTNTLSLPQTRTLPTGLLMLSVSQGGYQQVLKLEHR